jgi:hypothetical protein
MQEGFREWYIGFVLIWGYCTDGGRWTRHHVHNAHNVSSTAEEKAPPGDDLHGFIIWKIY